MSSSDIILFAILALACVAVLAATGIYVMRTLTLALEGHYEFKGDSLTKRSRLAGFVRVALWSIAVVTAWSFFIDWIWFQDLEFALAALALRLQYVLQIVAEIMSDN